MHKLKTFFLVVLLSGCAGQIYKEPSSSLNIAKLRFYVTPSLTANSSISILSYPNGKCDSQTHITNLGESQQIGGFKPITNAASGGIDAGVPKSPDFTYQKNNYVEIAIEADKFFYFQMVRDDGKIISFGPKKFCRVAAKFIPKTDKTYEALFNYSEAEQACILNLSEIQIIDGAYRQLKIADSAQITACDYQ